MNVCIVSVLEIILFFLIAKSGIGLLIL